MIRINNPHGLSKIEVGMFFKSLICKTHQDHLTEMSVTENSIDHTLILNQQFKKVPWIITLAFWKLSIRITSADCHMHYSSKEKTPAWGVRRMSTGVPFTNMVYL